MDKKIKLQREWFRTMQAEGIRDPRLLGRIWECVDGKGFVNQAFNDPAEQPLQILLRDTAPFVEGAKIQAELSRSLSKADEMWKPWDEKPR